MSKRKLDKWNQEMLELAQGKLAAATDDESRAYWKRVIARTLAATDELMTTMQDTWHDLIRQAQRADDNTAGNIADLLRDAADDVARAIATFWAGDKDDADCPTYIIKTVLTPEEWKEL